MEQMYTSIININHLSLSNYRGSNDLQCSHAIMVLECGKCERWDEYLLLFTYAPTLSLLSAGMREMWISWFQKIMPADADFCTWKSNEKQLQLLSESPASSSCCRYHTSYLEVRLYKLSSLGCFRAGYYIALICIDIDFDFSSTSLSWFFQLSCICMSGIGHKIKLWWGWGWAFSHIISYHIGN